jgi:cell wall-associated NlpC family hydrolase
LRLVLIIASITSVGALSASCGTLKRVSGPTERKEQQISSSTASPAFIESISFKPGSDDPPAPPVKIDKIATNKDPHTINTAEAIEVLPTTRFKYAILLDATVEELDEKLIGFLEDWYGTRYRLGGADKSGIDCSALVQSFFASMYGLNISRTCREQYSDTRRIKKAQLQEGDLVFFKTRGRSISHVGIYLRNNKFIHASTSSGVMISDLSDEYFTKRYAGAGRF